MCRFAILVLALVSVSACKQGSSKPPPTASVKEPTAPTTAAPAAAPAPTQAPAGSGKPSPWNAAAASAAPSAKGKLWDASNVSGGKNPVVLHTAKGDVEIRFLSDDDISQTAVVRAGSDEQVLGTFTGASLAEAVAKDDVVAVALASHDVKGDTSDVKAYRLMWQGNKLVTTDRFEGSNYMEGKQSKPPRWLPTKSAKLLDLDVWEYTPPSERK